MQKFRVVLIGDGINPYEKELKSMLESEGVQKINHLILGEDGILREHGRRADLEAYLPQAHLVLNLGHHGGHDFFRGLLRDHNIPSISYEEPFHHSFAPKSEIENLALKLNIIIPHTKRLVTSELGPDTMSNLFQSILLPVRIAPDGKKVGYELKADSFERLQNGIEEMASLAPYIDIIREVKGDRLIVYSIGDFRDQEIYTTVPVLRNKEGGLRHATHLSNEEKEYISKVAKEFHNLYPQAHAVRTELIKTPKSTYLHSTRPISIMHAQPTLSEALKITGANMKELLVHLMKRTIEKVG